jgi:ribosomal protein L44E
MSQQVSASVITIDNGIGMFTHAAQPDETGTISKTLCGRKAQPADKITGRISCQKCNKRLAETTA